VARTGARGAASGGRAGLEGCGRSGGSRADQKLFKKFNYCAENTRKAAGGRRVHEQISSRELQVGSPPAPLATGSYRLHQSRQPGSGRQSRAQPDSTTSRLAASAGNLGLGNKPFCHPEHAQ